MSGRSVSSPRSFSSMAGALGFRRGFRDGVLMCTALVSAGGLASGVVELVLICLAVHSTCRASDAVAEPSSDVRRRNRNECGLDLATRRQKRLKSGLLANIEKPVL